MSRRKTYRVLAERGETAWVLDVPEIKRSTQSLRLDQAERMASELISIMTERTEGSFDVAIEIKLDQRLEVVIERAKERRRTAVVAQQEASAAQRTAARSLADAGLTTRDAGQLLGLTHQRIAQLLAEH